MQRLDPRGYARAYRVFCEADPWLDGRLGALCVPALFVTGELDPNSSPAMSRAMAAEAPLGRAVVLAGERHMMAYISPDRFNPVVEDFLDRTAVSSGRRAATGQVREGV
jgi:pimeloyl-ACP methyl ester carboxylesterase